MHCPKRKEIPTIHSKHLDLLATDCLALATTLIPMLSQITLVKLLANTIKNANAFLINSIPPMPIIIKQTED